MPTDNNSLKIPFAGPPTVGPLEGSQRPLQELLEDSILAPNVRQSYPTKINSSTTLVPLYSPTSDLQPGMNTSEDYTSPQVAGKYSVKGVIKEKQNQSEPLEQSLEENCEKAVETANTYSEFVDNLEQIKDESKMWECANCRKHFSDTTTLDKHFPLCLAENPDSYAFSVKTLGLKYDDNKPPLAYIPKAALWAEGGAFAYGAKKKYEAWNYKNGIKVSRTLSAALRHIMQFLDGQDNDEESGVNHLGCARANLAMALDTLANHPEMDDRFKKEDK